MSKTQITYKEIAPGAAEDAAFTSQDSSTFSDINLLAEEFARPPKATCEHNNWGLDGTYELTPRVVFWSKEMSGEDCRFTKSPQFSVVFDKQYSSPGLTFVFDPPSGAYCTSLNVKWYQGDTLKAEGDFSPDSTTYYCKQSVTSFDRILITLNATNLPERYAKVNQLIFGIYRHFGMTEIRKASIVNEMNYCALELPISTMDWTLDSHESIDYMFQFKQPIEVRNDDALLGVYYIDSYKKVSSGIYNLSNYDAFGVLNESTFPGGVYTDYSAKQLLQDIVGESFDIDFEIADTQLTGIISPGLAKRDAMKQVLFAWGVCASTDGRESIRVFTPPDTVTNIGTGRAYTGVTVSSDTIITEVRVTAHTYEENSNGSVEVNGKKYSDTQTVYTVANPNVTASDKPNVKEVKEATLISNNIGQSTAQRVYDYYMQTNTANAKIVWRGERLGDRLSVPNQWGGTNEGVLQKMEISLSNKVAATCEVKGS